MVTTLIVVLVVIGVAAVVSVPLMIRSTRRQVVEDVSSGARRPAPGSPAQVLVTRGEQVLRRLGSVGPHPGLPLVSADTAEVVAELRLTASQVAELDEALARVPVPALEDELRTLGAAVAEAEASGRPAASDLARAHEAVGARLALARRWTEAREALLARMQATVTELERALDELADLVAGPTTGPRNELITSRDPVGLLTGRLDALREALVRVREAANPEIAPGGQGEP